MTEDQKRALSNWLPGRISHLNDKESTQEGGLTAGQFFQRASYQIALVALTQPASTALKLPDEWSKRTDYEFDLGAESGWSACLAEVKRLNAPHTAPIEPICATGGAEWVKCCERMPDFDIDVMVYCADTEEQFVAYHRNDGVFHYATYTKGNAYVNIVCEPTHWMPLPSAPEE